MFRCAETQALLLEYVYDVLEADERALVQAHLDLCPECQLALRDAQGQQNLFATAARLDFSQVQFTPPESDILPMPAPRPQPAARKGTGSWRRWAAVAALLLSIAGPAGLSLDYLDARRDLAHHEERRRELDRQHQALNGEFMERQEQFRQLVDKRQEAVLAKHRTAEVSMPQQFQSGGNNGVLITIKDGEGNTVPGTIREVLVKNERNETISLGTNLNSNGTLRMTLPQTLQAAPTSRWNLQVKLDGNAPSVTEEFVLLPPTYLTHLYTDKPMYQPGETVRFRSLTLERFSLQPAAEALDISYTLAKPNQPAVPLPQGDARKLLTDGESDGYAVMGPERGELRGIGAGEWTIPANAPGGEYTLTVQEAAQRFPPQQRKFVVNKFHKPRFMKELVWNKRTYGPGDDVLASLEVKSSEGPVANTPVVGTVTIDGVTFGPYETRTNEAGKAIVRFGLPQQMNRGLASLNLEVRDKGGVEPLLKPIPVALKKLDVEFYPEGGYLVPYIENRVYFQARTTLGKPADLRGRLIDDTGEEWAQVRTLSDDHEPGVNQGMGVFHFKPLPDSKDASKFRNYRLVIDSPAGVTDSYPLRIDGWGAVHMSIPTPVTTSYQPIDVKLRSIDRTRKLLVGAYCRGRLFDHVRLDAPAGKDVNVTLRPEQGVGGVYRITVFEEEDTGGARPRLIPRSERLVYRQQRERLNLEVALGRTPTTPLVASRPLPEKLANKELETLKRGAVPGAKVELDLLSRGENQEPLPAILTVAVVDRGLLRLADEKTARSMPTHFLLTSEVRKPEELEYADFLLTSHPKAMQALDLLLGTQGWRRFVEQKPGEARQKVLEEAQLSAALAFGVEAPRVVHGDKSKAEDVLRSKLEAERAKVAADFAAADAEWRKRSAALTVESVNIERAGEPAERRAAAWSERIALVRPFAPLAVIFLIMGAGVLLMRGLNEQVGRSGPYFLGALACGCFVAFTFVLTSDPHRREEMGEKNVAEIAGGIGRFEDGGDWLAIPQASDRAITPTIGLPKDVAGQVEPFTEPAKEEKGEGLKQQGQRGFTPDFGKLSESSSSPRSAAKTPAPPAAPPQPAKPTSGLVLDRPKTTAPETQLVAPGGAPASEPRLDTYARTVLVQEQAKKDAQDARFYEKQNATRKTNLDDLVSASKRSGVRRSARQPWRESDGKEGKDKDDRLGIDVAKYYVREYAYERQPVAEGEPRSDFTDTVYWHPALVLRDGSGRIRFDVSDALTSYQVIVFGHTLDGRLAVAKPFSFDTRLPLALDSATPLEVTTGDKVIVSVTAANNTDQQRDVEMKLKKNLGLDYDNGGVGGGGSKSSKLTLDPRSSGRMLYRFSPSSGSGSASIEVEAEAKGLRDSLARTFTVTPEGFPVVEAWSDLLEGGEATHKIELPETWVRGTLQLRLQAFPSALADLRQGLDGLLREPHGCFEQTSTTNYPNVMILSYLRDTKQAKPEVERKARELMERGYERLTSFECRTPDGRKREGFEWFGGTAPPHEALTAYGLLQFRDMASFGEVDRDMMERTRRYLLQARDGKGGFKRNPRSGGQFGRAPDHLTNAYIVWALTESVGPDDFAAELNAVHGQAKESNDPYFLGLVANSLINRGRSAEAVPLLDKAAKAQHQDGYVAGAETSITGSGGRDLQIETTALALLGWLKADPGRFGVASDRAVKWIGRQRGNGGAFGSTQATILALKALIAHTRGQRPVEKGTLTLWVNDRKVGEVNVVPNGSEALVINLPDAEAVLKPGRNTVRVAVTGKNQFPYTVGWSYQTLKPVSDPRSVLKLSTSLARPTAVEGESVRLTVKLENTSAKEQGMAVAIVGLPGGLVLPEDLKQLREYTEAPKDGRPVLSMFEVRGRELILYWRDLAPREKIEVPIDLSCRVPGQYSGPASRAYLYYNADPKTWVEPLRIGIAPRQ